ncbi:type II toxin-antitoxin system RelE/ParE family toxin [Variovorax boronicumulans]|uniref:type II toxin-antitoxin system RelE/ParE family toxin n=1 Tax=Variovorax boronicumulans TaxID=436515 RepID=UPI00277FB1C6|nr:type II toxin-antitoxin system RelE/ParE family toxin [Variovorax boronicumulans]MDQ0042743.1 plasmid stabilization system protein ParE [Variovorax boronicumulans]
MKVVFLRSAEVDLKDLRRYLIKNFGTDTWAASYDKIKQSVVLIEAHPQAGRIPEELENLNAVQYRQVISGMNRIIYEVRLDIAYIHVVCDTRRDLKGLLMRRMVGAV